MKCRYYFLIGLIVTCVRISQCYNNCDRTPERAKKPPNKVDINRYVIEIPGNPKSYVPGENYTVSLKSNPSLNKYRFTEFTLVVEPENQLDTSQIVSTGNFQLIDQMLTRFSIKCRNTVIQTNTLAKSSVQVSWIAPPPKSGCIAIKATVFESSDNWFSDDGDLTKILCEEDAENEDIQPAVLRHCCACDEAKYEVALQGLWSRNTHPKDFPTDVWTTKFSDIVGASHKIFKSFWNYGGMSSVGLKLLAETGDSSIIETELKEMVKSDDIRTIIKARELSYPNITSTSYTVFRVDRDNHLISLVSKITPSPDWVIGVSNLELCLKNCSWAESRTLNLYPWDAGTDEGLSYNSLDYPSMPPQPIKRIKPNNPNKEQSPFHSPDGDPIKPFARLHITRQKLYEKECSGDDHYDNSEEVDPNCATSEWSQWSVCSDVCYQFRQRSYVNPTTSQHCQKTLVENVPCSDSPKCRNHPGIDLDDERCKLNEWSQWSTCSVPCGKGVRTRDRQFLRPDYQTLCTSDDGPELQENEECESTGEDCGSNMEQSEDDCPDTVWGAWTGCTVTCGTGTKERLRVMKNDNENQDDRDDDGNSACTSYKQTVTCFNPDCEDEDSMSPMFGTMDAESQVTNSVLISEEPVGPVTSCKVSKWSIWSPCNSSEPCKKGYKFKERHIIIHPQNGGKPCPEKLLKKKRCKAACSKNKQRKHDSRETYPTWGPSQPTEGIIDCEMESWSAWSPCSTICGGSAVQQRTRGILVYPSRNGRQCGPRKEERKCSLPFACTEKGMPPNY